MKYTAEVLATIAAESISVSEVMRKLGLKLTGGSHVHISNRLRRFGIDTSHFLGQAHLRGTHSPKKRPWQDILIDRSATGSRRQAAPVLRRALRESGRPYVCGGCGISPTWRGMSLVLQNHHKNGNWLDDRPENLDFLCPNCHSQTDTYGSLNMKHSLVAE